MIRQFNRSQTIKATFSAAGGIICFGLTWLFFRYLPAFAAAGFDYSWSPQVSMTIAWGAVLVVAFSGWRTWQKGGGLPVTMSPACFMTSAGTLRVQWWWTTTPTA